jgi:phage tail sheath protein FI
MPFQVSPGVNVSEIDLTTVVPAVSTTEGAVVGNFKWGPVNQRVLVDSEDRLVNIFNKPNANNANEWFTAANFLAYGNQLYVVRGTSVTSGSTANNATTGNTAAYIESEDYYNESYTNSSQHGDWVAKYPGDLGNSLKVSVCQNANAWQQSISTGTSGFVSTANVSFTFTAGSKNIAIGYSGNTSHQNATAKFVVGDHLYSANNNYLGQIKSITSNTQIVMKANYVAYTDGGTANTTLVVGSTADGGVSSTITRRWEYFGNFDQAPTTTNYGNTAQTTGDALHVAIVDEDGKFSGAQGTVLELYENVSMASDAKTDQGATNYYKDVINQRSPYVWWGKHNTNIVSNAGNPTTNVSGGYAAGSDLPLTNSFAKGVDGASLTGGQKTAFYDKFKSSEDLDVSFILGADADTTLATHLITNIAETRKDCIVVLSPERADVVNNTSYSGKERDDIISFRDGLPSSSYAVMDSGWKYQYDKYNDLYRYVPLNADTAGLMVQTDLTRDPWYSPAGFNRGNVKNAIKLAYNPSKADRDQLYKKGVNPVVTFPGQGTVLYGDKTLLAQPSAFDRINVRRLFIVLEKAISTAANFTLFEFNDEFTRAQFKNLVEPFLRDVQGRRGINDFTVVCDGTNNTGEVIDRNEFVGDIYIKPARSINFIQLNFVAVRTGVEFSEIVGRAT